MNTKIGKFRIKQRWIDVLTLSILVITIILEIVFASLYNKSGEDSIAFIKVLFENVALENICRINKEYINSVITLLLPVVATILSVSMSVSHEQIYGLTLARFRRVNKNEKYTLTGMVVFSFVIFAISILLYCFDLVYSLIVINLIALFYSIYFCVMEISLLSRMDWRLNRIIKSAYKSYSKIFDPCNDDSLFSTGNENNFSWAEDCKTIFGSVSYDKTLEDATKLVQPKEEDIEEFNNLLSFYEPILKQACYNDLVNQDRLVRNALNNINFYFEKIKQYDFNRKVRSGVKPIVGVNNTVAFYLEKNNLFDTYQDDLYKNIVLKLNPSLSLSALKGDYQFYFNRISNYLLISSLHSKSTYYSKLLLSAFKSKNNNLTLEQTKKYALFVSIFLFYVKETNSLGDDFTTCLEKLFTNEWKEDIRDYLLGEIGVKTNYISLPSLFEDMLDFYDDFKDVINEDGLNIDLSETGFSKQYIVKWWLGRLAVDQSINDSKCVKMLENSISFDNNTINLINDSLKVNPRLSSYISEDSYFGYIGLNAGNEQYIQDIFKYLSTYKTVRDSELAQESEEFIREDDLKTIQNKLEKFISDNSWCSKIIDNDIKENTIVRNAIIPLYYSEKDREEGLQVEEAASQYVTDQFVSSYKSILNGTNNSRFDGIKDEKVALRIIETIKDCSSHNASARAVLKYKDKSINTNAIKVNISFDYNSMDDLGLDERDSSELVDSLFYYYNDFYRDNKTNRFIYKSKDDFMDMRGYHWYICTIPVKFEVQIDVNNLIINK